MKKTLAKISKTLRGERTAKGTAEMNKKSADYPWLAHYPEGVDWFAELEEHPVYSFLDESVERFGPKACVNFLGKIYSYSEIGALADQAAKGFQLLGVKKGTKVGLCLPNTPYAVICFYGILKAGGTVVNYSPLYVERELKPLIEQSETEIMVTLNLKQIYPKVAAMLDQTPLRTIVVCSMQEALPPIKSFLFSAVKRSEIATFPDDLQHIPFERLVRNDGNVRPAQVNPSEDIAVLQFTGGTTGIPKAVMLSHANLVANTQQARLWSQDFKEGEERIVGVLPLFHVFAMTNVMNVGISAGCELILLPRFELDQLLETITKTKATVLMAVPTIYTAINNHGKIDKYDISSLKYGISGGAPLLKSTAEAFNKISSSNIVEGYGLSETSPSAITNPLDGRAKPGSIGIPLPRTVVEILSLEGDGKVMPVGEKGEVCISGPQVMKGYWNNPDATAEALRNGRLHTGDVGYMDEEGFVFLVDRIKDLILCGGFNVYPRDIEEAISLHPAIAEVSVIGVPDDYRGETPKAFMVLRDGQTLTEEELKAFLSDKLSAIERPSLYEFRKELPKTLIGKLSKKELIEEEEAKRAQNTAA